MSGGADEAGDDMVVGRTNESEVRTILVVKPTLDYSADFVLSVGIEGGYTPTTHHQGVDAIHAIGAVPEPPDPGGIREPAANGVVGRGLNGIVGYPHAAPRDRAQEREAQAGVFGAGGPDGAGVFGRGRTGVVGCEQGTPRDPAYEASETAGVLGRGPTGISGDGVSGPGVHGRGTPGVFGEGANANPGVFGDGGADGVGVYGQGRDGPGVQGQSHADRGGIFESRRRAQVWIVPLDIADPTKLPSPPGAPARAEAGELCVTITRDQRTNMRPVASLWFCKESTGLAATANWVQIA
jgi:hypothetical protein